MPTQPPPTIRSNAWLLFRVGAVFGLAVAAFGGVPFDANDDASLLSFRGLILSPLIFGAAGALLSLAHDAFRGPR